MRMKYLIFGLLLLIFPCASAKTVRVNAIKANDYGVIYSLPKTSFEITLLVRRVPTIGSSTPHATIPGVDNPITENRIEYVKVSR